MRLAPSLHKQTHFASVPRLLVLASCFVQTTGIAQRKGYKESFFGMQPVSTKTATQQPTIASHKVDMEVHEKTTYSGDQLFAKPAKPPGCLKIPQAMAKWIEMANEFKTLTQPSYHCHKICQCYYTNMICYCNICNLNRPHINSYYIFELIISAK